MTSTMSRSEREAMEEFAIREWYQEETAWRRGGDEDVTMVMNIELIHLKMYELWTFSPIVDTIQDVARAMPLQTRPWEAAIIEVLRLGAFSVDSTTPLQSQHIDFVKSLLDETLDRRDELQDWEGTGVWEDVVVNQTADAEKDKKKKESCMDAMNLLDSVMKSGECMKEVDYLKMCNLLKELYN